MKLSWRVWLLIIILIASLFVLFPNFEKGVAIKSVEKNSTAYEQGLRPDMVIKSINGEAIENFQDYSRIISSVFPNSAANSKKINASKDNIKLTINTKDSEFILYTNNAPEITVTDIPRSRIKTGLDLSGGARAIVKAENKSLTSNELNDLISVTSNRLNEFGIADVSVKSVSDLSGNNFMLVEVAGASTSDLTDLISQQGKFEAKIGNETIFIGGKADITYVARTGEQSGIYSCNELSDGYICEFRFSISLSEAAAKRQAAATGKLGMNQTEPQYLEKKLDLYLDDQLVESLAIGKDLKGSETTQIMISGPGTGKSQQEAYEDAENAMKKLQTVLITGSLPYKLEIIKIDSISPSLGKEFTQNLIWLGIIVFIGVGLVIFFRYRKIKITLAVLLTMISEAGITIAIAALIHWNLDAPSIAGIIAGIGTGVNDQIVLIDESLSKGTDSGSLKERLKTAFFIIFTAFFLVVAAMIPLFWAGAGMLKGFALTTIIGVSIGVLITRPAFSDIIKMVIKE